MRRFLPIKMITFFLLMLLVVSLFYRSIMENGMHNMAFLHLMRPFISSTSELINPDLERARASFHALSEGDGDRYRAYQDRLDGLARLLTSLPYNKLHEGRTIIIQAKTNLMDGNLGLGKELLQQAIDTDVKIIQLEAHLILAQQLASESDDFGYNQNMEMAAAFSSQSPVQTDVCPDWSLQGVFIDARELIVDQPVHILLIWQRMLNQPDDLSQNEGAPIPSIGGVWWTWTWRDYLFQAGVVPNLVKDGGFEHVVLPHQGIPLSFPFKLHGQDLRYTELVYAETNISQNMTLLLDGKDEEPVGLSTQPIAFPDGKPNGAYLVTGRYRSDESAAPLIGIRWLLKDTQTFSDNVSTYIVRHPSPQWVAFAGLFVPPDKAEKLQFWVVNADQSTYLQVDDLGLWYVPLACDQILME